MIKKTLCVLLSLAMLLVPASFTVSAEESDDGKQIIVDGNLDVWYLEEGDTDNDYYFPELDAYMKPNGKLPFLDPVTSASVWTAYDDTYIYLFVKVWDDELIPWDAADTSHVGMSADSSGGDSIEIWLDPDPLSMNESIRGTENQEKFCWHTKFEDEGDIQLRLQGQNFFLNDYFNKVKPGYNGVAFGDWIKNPDNFMPFYFTDEENEMGVKSGYGVEARFPRNDDASGYYRFNIAVNNSAEFEDERYTLAIGAAWWLGYSGTAPVYFHNVNPFFSQDVSGKSVVYYDSAANKAGKDVDAAVGTMADTKTSVSEVVAKYNALNDVQKGLVSASHTNTLVQSAKKYDLEVILPATYGSQGTDSDKKAADNVIALINQLVYTGVNQMKDAVIFARSAYDKLSTVQKAYVNNYSRLTEMEIKVFAGDVNGDKTVNASDALMALKAAVKKIELTAEQKAFADINHDGSVNAGDALLMLKIAVGKYTVEF